MPTPPAPDRRNLLKGLCTLPLGLLFPVATGAASGPVTDPAFYPPLARDSVARLTADLAELEAKAGGRLGVALVCAGKIHYARRGNEAFPFCSTFKALAAAGVLHKAVAQPDLLEQHILYRQEDLVEHSPVTTAHLTQGLRLAELCEAAVRFSDNTAANLLLDVLGGPAALTDLVRSWGGASFRLDRRETELNSATPGDVRDTCTPGDMALSLYNLVCGPEGKPDASPGAKPARGPDVPPGPTQPPCPGLPAAQRALLLNWLRRNTTGQAAIRAGLPKGWEAGDKTGSGAHGTSNDLAVLWPPQRRPLTLATYLTGAHSVAAERQHVLAQASALTCAAFLS